MGTRDSSRNVPGCCQQSNTGLSAFCNNSDMRGYRTTKYTLFIFCYAFSVVSSVLIAVGIYAKIAKEKDVVDTLTADPALLLIVVGSVMFLTTFFGCFGSLRNATCLLKTFLGILSAILLLQISAAVVGYIFSDMVLERTERLMMKAVRLYREDLDLENAIDFVQKKFQCCGVETYRDWSQNVYFECSDTNPSLEACGVPFSCCLGVRNKTVLNTMCGYGVQDEDQASAADEVHTVGCLEKIISWIKNHLLLVGGLSSGLLMLEIGLIALAASQICRINKVQKQKKENEERGKGDRKDSVWYPAFADFDDE